MSLALKNPITQLTITGNSNITCGKNAWLTNSTISDNPHFVIWFEQCDSVGGNKGLLGVMECSMQIVLESYS